MDNLSKLKNAISDSINKVNSMGNFNIQELKDEVTPLLEEAKKRLDEIEHINDNINGIRNEIINPVSTVISSNSKKSNWLAISGILMGLIGIFLTIISQNSTSSNYKASSSFNNQKEKVIIAFRNIDGNTQKLQKLTIETLTKEFQTEKFTLKSHFKLDYKNRAEFNPPFIYYRNINFNHSILNIIDKFCSRNDGTKYNYYILRGIERLRSDSEISKIANDNKDVSLIIVL